VGDPWGEPTNIGKTVNSDKGDYVGSLAPDGLTLFFPSSRSGGVGEADIWMSRRASLSEPWGKPTNLGPTINTDSTESDGRITADGLTLIFGSRLSAYPYDHVIWMATRTTRNQPFGERAVLGANLTSGKTEGGATLSADGRELYFHSNRRDGRGGWDLWTARRTQLP